MKKAHLNIPLILFLVLISTVTIASLVNSGYEKSKTSGFETINMKDDMPDISSWPEASQMAAKEMMDKYGKPDGTTEDMLIWKNKGMWKMIKVDKAETKHNFPIGHTDMLMQCLSFKVPMDKYDELASFDGSVAVDRTQGLLSARCDKEANNLLALNLAHDVITGKKSVEQARSEYGKIVLEKANGGDPEYMKKLMFSPSPNSEDPDKNTTGKDKKDLEKMMMKQK
jgi:hypothetical protein